MFFAKPISFALKHSLPRELNSLPGAIKFYIKREPLSHEASCERLSISILMFVFPANKAHAQAAPLYDVTYTPDTGSASYSGEVSARTKPPNVRGQSSPTIAFASSARGPRTTTIVGSQSYN